MRGPVIRPLAVALGLALLAATPAARPARAQGAPDVPEPTCVLVRCSCDPPGEMRPCDTDCAALCGGGDAGGGTTGSQGTPPILKLAAYAVGAAAVTLMFLAAPAHTATLLGTSPAQSAAAARAAWDAHRADLRALEEDGRRAAREARALDAAVRAEVRARPPAAGAAYAPAPPTPGVEPWAPRGPCAEAVASTDALLADADARARAHARDLFPTYADVNAAAREQGLAALARLAGPAKHAAQREALVARLGEARELAAFLDELRRCVDDPDTAGVNSCLLLLVDRTNQELQPLLDEFREGLGDAAGRVREAATFFRGYVTDLERGLERHALLAARCR